MIDAAAWVMVRIMGLFMGVLGDFISMFYHPSPVKDYDGFNFLVGLQMTGWMMFYSKAPDGMPKIISERLLFMGKILLLVFAFLLFDAVWDVAVLRR